MADRTESMPDADAIEVMRATLTEDYFDDPDWIYERKLDGVRVLARRQDGVVRLHSRSQRDMTTTWPELADALAEQDGAFLVDGEIVAFEGERTSFSRLQHRVGISDEDEARSRADEVKAYLYLFDVLHLEGESTRELPLRERKALLKRSLRWSDPVRYTPHRNEHGIAYREEACRKGWEGVIAKDATTPYRQTRSREWLKFKCVHQQELVIVGFTEPGGSRVGFGALLLGYHDNGALVFAGRVGTGFDDALLRGLRDRLDDLERDEPPVDDPPSDDDLHWVEPRLVGEIGFTEWTDDGKLRHPRFLGLRTDKDPGDVVRERPEAT